MNVLLSSVTLKVLLLLQLVPYHFCPPGFLHPITAIYELTYGETEMKQGINHKAFD